MADPALTQQLALSAAIVWLLERLKGWPACRWIAADTDQLNRRLAVVCAFVSALGLSAQVSGTFAAGGTLTITWPSLAQLYEAGTRFVAQVAMQELVYRGAVKRSTTALQAPATHSNQER
jgi:hypothetical protein